MSALTNINGEIFQNPLRILTDLIKFQTGPNGKPVGIGIIGPGATPEQIEERLEMHAKNAVLAVSHLMKHIKEWK